MARIKAYLGLSLDKESAVKILPDAHIAPPIKRGDLLQDMKQGIGVVIIVDGTFRQNLAVAPDEIMDALCGGVKVYGASSMGAMRASELRDFGMIGYGRIFEHIVASKDFRDDFLAQTFEDDNGTLKTLSYPYIDFYMNVVELRRLKHISVREMDKLLAFYKDFYYPDRCWPALRNSLRQHASSGRLLKLAEKACTGVSTQKRRDAVGVLKQVREDLSHTHALNAKLAGRHGPSSRRRHP